MNSRLRYKVDLYDIRFFIFLSRNHKYRKQSISHAELTVSAASEQNKSAAITTS
jgi:hypothetical protein